MKSCPQCGTEYPDGNTLCTADGAALETTGDPLIGEILAGKYRVEERLSVGGMGAVYRGTHVLMDKTVAIKVLRPSLAADEKIVARFSLEARAASRISHPHALSVTDFGEAESGVVFLVMEFLDGRTLKDVIRQTGPLPLPRVVEIMRQVCGALEAAHAVSVIHRDLKSDNIMLVKLGGPDYAKVLDFGIAKINEGGADSGLTSPDLVMGTPHYMSPEQCSQLSEIDARSDVYSLGIIVYEMLTGHVPFMGESATTVMLKHLQEAPPSVLDERSDLPASVGLVVSRALAKRPEDRYQSVGALIEDLVISAEALGATAAPVFSEVDSNEDTIVRVQSSTASAVAARVVIPPPAAVARFNFWRIIIPLGAALAVVFVVIFVFTRNSEPPANTNQPPNTLSADPNGRAVQPTAPATGVNEAGIPLGSAGGVAGTAPTPSPTPLASPSPDTNTPSPTPAPNPSLPAANASTPPPVTPSPTP
jgi:serine/threonine-protein kinase